jgi:hypothetical protein
MARAIARLASFNTRACPRKRRYVLEGRMALRMDDGTEREFGPGETVHMAPGHDAWIVGDEACVLLDFGGLKGYAQAS